MPVERRDVLGGLIHEYRWVAGLGLLNPSSLSTNVLHILNLRVQRGLG